MSAAATFGTLAVSAGVLLLMGELVGAQRYVKMANRRQEMDSKSPLDPAGPPVQFVLYSRNNMPLNLNLNKTLNETTFDFDAPTKIIIHGFLSSINAEVFTLPKNAFLSKGAHNVIGLDWSVLCEFEYFSAMKGMQIAGAYLTRFIEYLVSNGVNYEDVHIIGHSLGAHVAGVGADNVRGGKIARITGLDPAGPGFAEMPHNLKLDAGDAKLVDAIHTYMSVLSLTEPLGHVDFYPNGGRFQPGCPDFFDIWKVPESVMCNHGRAYLYYAESVLNEKAFKSQRCSSVRDAVYGRCFEESDVYMGAEDTYSFGQYYVKTRSSPPFSLSHQ